MLIQTIIDVNIVEEIIVRLGSVRSAHAVTHASSQTGRQAGHVTL